MGLPEPVEELVEPAATSIMDAVLARLDSAINAIAFLVGVVLLLVMGVRPLTKSLNANDNLQPALDRTDNIEELPELGAVEPEVESIQVEDSPAPLGLPSANNNNGDPSELIAKMRPEAADRLTMIVDLDEARAAAILRRWVTQEST